VQKGATEDTPACLTILVSGSVLKNSFNILSSLIYGANKKRKILNLGMKI
jgi:hypothetical protein